MELVGTLEFCSGFHVKMCFIWLYTRTTILCSECYKNENIGSACICSVDVEVLAIDSNL